MDFTIIKSFIHSLFQQGGSATLSKSQMLSMVMKSDKMKSALPFFQQLPEKQDYTEASATEQMQNITQKQGGAGSTVSKIRSKVGI